MNKLLKDPEYYNLKEIIGKVIKINNIPRKYKRVEPFERGEYFMGDAIIQEIKAKYQDTSENEE